MSSYCVSNSQVCWFFMKSRSPNQVDCAGARPVNVWIQLQKFWNLLLFRTSINQYVAYVLLTLKYMGGLIQSIAGEIACHFSQDHTMVTKFLDFIHKHPKYKVVKSFFYYLDRFSRNSAETEPRLWFFGVENRKIDFFQFFHNKIP